MDPLARTLERYELRDGEWLLIETLKDDDPILPMTFFLAELWS